MKIQNQRLLKIAYVILAAYTICAILFDLLLHSDVMLPASIQSTLFLSLILSVFGAGNVTLAVVGVVISVVYFALLIPTLLSPLTRTKKGFFFNLLHFAVVLDVIACVMIFFTGEHLLAVLNIVLDLALLFLARQLKRNVLSDAAPESDAPEEPKDA